MEEGDETCCWLRSMMSRNDSRDSSDGAALVRKVNLRAFNKYRDLDSRVLLQMNPQLEQDFTERASGADL